MSKTVFIFLSCCLHSSPWHFCFIFFCQKFRCCSRLKFVLWTGNWIISNGHASALNLVIVIVQLVDTVMRQQSNEMNIILFLSIIYFQAKHMLASPYRCMLVQPLVQAQSVPFIKSMLLLHFLKLFISKQLFYKYEYGSEPPLYVLANNIKTHQLLQ